MTQILALAHRRQHWSLALALLIALLSIQPVLAASTVHVVQPGESLSEIAVSYGVSMSALAAANNITNANHVYVGQRLTIPGSDGGYSADTSSNDSSGAYVTVGRGDSLSLIASLNGMTTEELMALNGLTNPNHVLVGQRLRVNGNAGNTTASSTTASSSYPSPLTNAITYVVQPGDSLSQIAKNHGMTVQALMEANGLSNSNYVWVGQQLQVENSSIARGADATYAPPAGQKRIVVDLSDQTLTAWSGDTIVLYTSISSGVMSSPTVTGHYRIYLKLRTQHMVGPGYDIDNVPWVMYFWDEYAFHGADWHNNFGMPMSHGCVHLRDSEAELLYKWAEIGTDVYVNG
ncbi:MAG: LysM peptidoglycan-binding domain-containing protein [Caldilineaceae bacterium]